MRDAFGSTFMFRIIIIFIVFYVTFATIAVSYAKTFRIKNRLIDYIEQHELNVDNVNFGTSVDDFLTNEHYSLGAVLENARKDCQARIVDDNGTFTNRGACVIKDGDHYIVSVYIPIDMPVNLFSAVIPVRGVTRKMVMS